MPLSLFRRPGILDPQKSPSYPSCASAMFPDPQPTPPLILLRTNTTDSSNSMGSSFVPCREMGTISIPGPPTSHHLQMSFSVECRTDSSGDNHNQQHYRAGQELSNRSDVSIQQQQQQQDAMSGHLRLAHILQQQIIKKQPLQRCNSANFVDGEYVLLLLSPPLLNDNSHDVKCHKKQCMGCKRTSFIMIAIMSVLGVW